MTKRCFSLLAFALLSTSCYRVPDQIEPKVDSYVQDRYLTSLPSPFPPLTSEEKIQDWGKEYQIALLFAREMDLYQAITAFKRASFLLPSEHKQRKEEIDYEILLCYYVGKKYSEVIYTYEHSSLRFAGTQFSACEDLLIILYDCYTQEQDTENANRFLQYIQTYYPETAKKLQVATDLRKADLASLKTIAQDPEYLAVKNFLETYDRTKKSIAKAQTLNAFLPGAGYLYLGQKQTAITAALINGLFIGASYYFFQAGNIPAGVIFTTFEAGWYFGGIYGAGEEAKFYNERIYEALVTPMMNHSKMFPVFMISHAF